MSEDTLTVTPESAPATNVAAPSTTVTDTTATSNGVSEQTTAQPAAQATPDATAPKKEWDGHLESLKELGKDEVERAKGMRRYLTKKTQELSEAQKQAQEYQQLKSDPRFQQFLNGPIQNIPPQQQQQPQPLWTEAEWTQAQIDPAKMAELFDRGVQARVNQVASQYAPLIQQLQAKQTFVEKSQEIDEFARIHPDVWDLYDAGIMLPLVKSVVDSGQGTFAEAYEIAKKQEAYYQQRATQAAQGRVLEKKAAVTAAPSPTSEPSIVWAEDRQHATRLAFENALQGKKVDVRVRK